MPRPDMTSNKLSGISRRNVLAGTAAAAAAGLVGVSSSRAATPRKGGHLKFGLEGGTQDGVLDPGTYSTQFVQNIGYMWGNSLIEIDGKGLLVPELALEWLPDAGAKAWIFKLRKDVRFHNGKTMTADDVVYSLNHHRKPDSKSLARGIFRGVTDIKASGPLEVTITLEAPNIDLPGLMADYHLLIMPEGGNPNAGIGTGPYIIERFEPGVLCQGKRNTNYWKTDRAHVDTVEVLAINDLVARQSALQGGLVHFISRPDPKLAPIIRANPAFTWMDLPGAQHYVFPMRCDVEPFNNKDLRLAMKYAIDRQDLLTRIFSGLGQIGNDHPVPTFDPMFSAAVPQRSYDPDKAKFHFQKSGLTGPVNLYISDAAFTGATAAATLYKEHAAKASINIEVNRMPADGYWSDVWKKRSFTGNYWGGRVTAGLMLQAVYLSDSANNETFWKRPDFDKLLTQAQAELNVGRRKEMFHDLQMMVWEDGGALLPLFANRLYASTSKVEGLVRSPQFTAFRAAEQLYFTS